MQILIVIRTRPKLKHYNRESKITKIPNSEKNSKRKVTNQMAKSKAQIHQTNG